MGSTSHTEFLASLGEPITLRGSALKPDGKYWSVDDVRKRLRSELALAVERGAIPAGTKFSVRGDYNSITVEIVEWSGAVFTSDYQGCVLDWWRYQSLDMHGKAREFPKGPPRDPSDSRDWRGMDFDGRYADGRNVPELNAVIWLVERMANRHNYDNSDIQTDYFDVGFHLNVTATAVQVTSERALRLEADPSFGRKQRLAEIAAETIGPKAAKANGGRLGVENAGEWTIGTLVKLAIKSGGYPLAYDKRARSWRPDKSQPKGLTYDERLAMAGIDRDGNAVAVVDSSCKADHASEECDECGTSPDPEPEPVRVAPVPTPAPVTPRCPHNHTQDGGRMYIDPTVFCRLCGAFRKMASTTWSDGARA